VIADYVSHLHEQDEQVDFDAQLEPLVCTLSSTICDIAGGVDDNEAAGTMTAKEMFTSVHGRRVGYLGAMRTYRRLSLRYPGHEFPLLTCAIVSSSAACVRRCECNGRMVFGHFIVLSVHHTIE